MSKLKYTLCRKVENPKRGTSKSAGIDLFIPEFTDDFLKDLYELNPQICQIRENEFEWLQTPGMLILGPHVQIKIPSGVKILGNKERMYPLLNKSGVATKKRLNRTAELIDEDYEGEIHIAIQNTSNFMILLRPGEKLIQMAETHIDYSELCEISNEEYEIECKTRDSERGTGGFGSTDNK